MAHQTTDEGNAPVCAQCHFHKNPSPAPDGTEIGCFNATLCHVHPRDWFQRDQHGAAAKAKPDGSEFKGFSSCQVCHGDDFSGKDFATFSVVSCFGCHTVNAPHTPAVVWGDNHITTNTANAPTCAQCHAGSSPTPAPDGTPIGCFNDTLCHNVIDPHPAGWADLTPGAPEPHGAAAKLAPSNELIQSFILCQSCHGDDFTGGESGQSCFTCHGGIGTPHPLAPWRDDTYTHTNTDRANAVVCAVCHAQNPIPPDTVVDCFNNTLCHGPK